MARRVFTLAIVLAAVSIGFVVTAPPASACSCMGLNDDEALQGAQVAFVGELLEVRTPPGKSFSSMDPERFVFTVDRVYKGEAKATQSVVTAREGASCGLELAGRGPFLVFATKDPQFGLDGDAGEVYSSLCSGSRALIDAPVPASFGGGQAPNAGRSPIGSLSDDDALPVLNDDDALPAAAVVVAGGLVLLIVLAIVRLVRRTRRGRADAATAS